MSRDPKLPRWRRHNSSSHRRSAVHLKPRQTNDFLSNLNRQTSPPYRQIRHSNKAHRNSRKMASYLGLPTPLVKPVAALAGWTFVMEAWMYATRLPAMSKYGVSTDPDKCKEDMNTKIPIQYRQIADNYNHREYHCPPAPVPRSWCFGVFQGVSL